MAQVLTVVESNRRIAEQINSAASQDPHSPYAGKFVGIVNGQVVAVDDDAEVVLTRLEQLEPKPENRFCFEAGLEYDRVAEIWSTR